MTILAVTTWSDMLLNSAVGIMVVFFALTILVLLFDLLQIIIMKGTKKRMVKAGKKEEEIIDIAANDIAAISMALHLYLSDIHDEESNVLTIKQIERRYSPWNSKIYGLNNLNR